MEKPRLEPTLLTLARVFILIIKQTNKKKMVTVLRVLKERHINSQQKLGISGEIQSQG